MKRKQSECVFPGTSLDRMPPLPAEALDERQRKAAEELAAGPRGGVKGPFIPLLRSPELLERLSKLGEYLRFGSTLAPRIGELVMLIVAREWTNQFEWAVHAPLAAKNGVARETILAVAEGRSPSTMAHDEQVAYALCDELSRTRGVSETTYRRAVACFGEAGVIDLLGVRGYFATVCAIMNVAHTPAPEGGGEALRPYPV
ncbi:MAG TPA: carboxymuconolactone decarboxylase family protein [Burkholderiales bacterium]